MKYKNLFLLVLAIALALPFNILAQEKPHDSVYYKTFPDKSTVRFYFSKKYTSLYFSSATGDADFKYRPNTQLTMGAGITYNNFSVNLSYGFGFLNGDDEKGKTKSIDFQGHIYPNKWAVDILGIRHKGLYIDPKGYADNNTANFYYRPDATMLLVGVGVYRVVNTDRFSYNAAMIQSEWQQKSAGSFLYGGEAYYSSIKADSNLIPKTKEHAFEEAGLDKLHSVIIGAGAGYGYTLVVRKHFFATGSVIANLDLGFSTEQTNGVEEKKTSLMPSFIYKAAIGFTAENWVLTANWTANTLWLKTHKSADAYLMPVGNYRFIIAKRIERLRKKK